MTIKEVIKRIQEVKEIVTDTEAIYIFKENGEYDIIISNYKNENLEDLDLVGIYINSNLILTSEELEDYFLDLDYCPFYVYNKTYLISPDLFLEEINSATGLWLEADDLCNLGTVLRDELDARYIDYDDQKRLIREMFVYYPEYFNTAMTAMSDETMLQAAFMAKYDELRDYIENMMSEAGSGIDELLNDYDRAFDAETKLMIEA